jgi:uncharacterized membrane protein YGL010W
MRNATELMVQYAAYHRDRRNISTHLVGIPLIVFAIGVLLARPGFEVNNLALTPAWVVWAASSLWYVTRGNFLLGVAVSALNGVLILLAQWFAGGSVASWLAWGLSTFMLGWALQFLGHYYEGRKPAFIDDLTGLLVGPMFIAAELLFSLGLCKSLLAEIESRVGPTHLRDLTHPVS